MVYRRLLNQTHATPRDRAASLTGLTFMLSKTALHAVKAVALLAELPPKVYAGTAHLATEISAPPNYLSKLLKSLAASGLLVSQNGRGGGFRLARHPRRVTIFSVVEPIDRVSRWNGCFLGRRRCSAGRPCVVHDRWGEVRDEHLQFLQQTTIADPADPAQRPKGW